MEEDLSTLYLAAANAFEVVSHLKPSFTRNAVPRLNSMSVFYSCEQLRRFREILESSASKIAIRWEFKHGAILYNEAEVFSLSITNPNGRSMLPFDWLIHPSLILASCHSFSRFSAVEK